MQKGKNKDLSQEEQMPRFYKIRRKIDQIKMLRIIYPTIQRKMRLDLLREVQKTEYKIL